MARLASKHCRARLVKLIFATCASALLVSVVSVPSVEAVTLMANEAPLAPALLAPSNGATLHRQGNQPFSISAVDPNGDPYTGIVIVKDAEGTETRFSTSPALSGMVSDGVLTEPLTPGAYTWTAVAIDIHGAESDPAVERSFTVNSPPTAGGGAVEGTVEFGAPGVLPTVCEPTSSTWRLVSPAVVLNTAVVGFVGALTMDGHGSSACESVLSGDGAVTFTAAGNGPLGSSLSCTLSGPYTRVHAATALPLSGSCEINDNPVSRVSVYITLAFVPVAADLGTTSRTEYAVVTGGFSVVPE